MAETLRGHLVQVAKNFADKGQQLSTGEVVSQVLESVLAQHRDPTFTLGLLAEVVGAAGDFRRRAIKAEHALGHAGDILAALRQAEAQLVNCVPVGDLLEPNALAGVRKAITLLEWVNVDAV